MGLTGQNAFYTACAYLHGPVFVFGGAISVSLRWTAVAGTNPLSLAALDSWFRDEPSQSRCARQLVPGEPSQSPTATASSPFCRLSATSSPGRGKSFEGRAPGKEGRSRPHLLTAGRSLLLSCKLYAFAKASPFRERWHGEAVTERVPSALHLLHPPCGDPFMTDL